MWFLIEILILPLSISIILLRSNSDTSNTDQFNGHEEKLISQFRELADNVLEYNYERTDDFLHRWLRECDMDFNCAVDRLRKSKQWRKENNIDSILNETIFEIRPHSSACSMGTHDFDGYPVLICELNGVDMRRLVLSGHKDSVARYYIQWIERLLSESRQVTMKVGKLMKYPIMIANLEGFNIRQHSCYQCIEVGRETIRMAMQYYPQLVDLLIMVNVPTIALPLIGIIKPILPTYYQNAIKVFGTNKEEWSKYLLEFISADQLPKEYGGTKLK